MSNNLIMFPTNYKGFQGNYHPDDLALKIRKLCKIPEINRIFNNQLQTVQEAFREEIDRLEASESGSNENTAWVPDMDEDTSKLKNKGRKNKIEIIDLQNNVQELSLEKKAEIFLDIFERVPIIQERIVNIFFDQILPFFNNRISSS